MENKGKSKGLIVLAVILILGLISSIGYILYSQNEYNTKKKEKNEEISSLKSEINNLKQENILETTDETEVDESYVGYYEGKNAEDTYFLALYKNSKAVISIIPREREGSAKYLIGTYNKENNNITFTSDFVISPQSSNKKETMTFKIQNNTLELDGMSLNKIDVGTYDKNNEGIGATIILTNE